MPIYTYRCSGCKALGTAFRKIAERDLCPTCTQCGASTEKIITSTMVSVFTPYKTAAIDKEQGRRIEITSQAEHNAFLRRNGYEEVGNDKSMAPIVGEELAHARAQKQKEEDEARNQPVFDFNEVTERAAFVEDVTL